MVRIGLICEYNPFHHGHIYHIQKIKEMYPDSLLILVLNGYFLERGEISLLTKEDKTKLALDFGIDLVLELPVLFGTQSADCFATASLSILNAFQVEKIIFGSEGNDIQKLHEICSYIQKPLYQEKVKSLLSTGLNYPTALGRALPSSLAIETPNDLLAISYMKAIQKNAYPIEAISIKRTNSYHDLKNNAKIVSASNIRHKWQKKEDISKFLPQKSLASLLSFDKQTFFTLLKMKILTTPHIEQFLTVDEGIENRLIDGIKKSNSLEDFIEYVKTKRYTYNKVNRMCIHILLGITKEENAHASLAYIKVLGFNSNGQNYLRNIKKNLSYSLQIDKNSLQYKKEIVASILYDLLMNTNTYAYEKKNKPIKKA